VAADVFLSYSRRDSETAKLVKDRLEDLGLTVFFDTEGLDGGDVFPEVLEREIRAVGATISLWNSYALTREWVRHEVKIAQEARNLIPVEIGPISDDVMTLTLSKLHRLNLTDFDGRADHAGWQDVVRALARTLKRPDLVKARAEREKAEARAARLEADLKAERARVETLKKAAPKRGLGRKGAVAIVFFLLVVASGAGWLVFDASRTARLAGIERDEAIAYLRSDSFRKTAAMIAGFDNAAPDARQALAAILATTDVSELEKAARYGDPTAALLAGWAYDFGAGGVAQDRKKSVGFYAVSCEGGNLRGCSNLGGQYANGEGVAEDDAEANRLFRQACEGGNMVGCTNLGVQYDDGEGVAEDDAEANRLYRQACEGGEMGGCDNLGVKYANGEGVAEDDAEANRLFRQACEGGNMSGCANLGWQ
jgi:hypothetical protein